MVGVTYKIIMQSHGMKMKQGKQKTSILIEVLWAEEQPLSYKKKEWKPQLSLSLDWKKCWKVSHKPLSQSKVQGKSSGSLRCMMVWNSFTFP